MEDKNKYVEEQFISDDDEFLQLIRQASQGDCVKKEENDFSYNLEDLLRALKQEVLDIKNESVYTKIKKLYPYISNGFLKNVYDLKNVFKNRYKTGIEIYILHRVTFNNYENLLSFTEIVCSHNYNVNVDEKKLLVDVIKLCINENGLILNDILNISNQVGVLKGKYEGYSIIDSIDNKVI